MKGSNSRFSLRPDRRYSNTAHIQGGMVTDADLTEAGQLHQERDEVQNTVVTGTGTPAVDGIVRLGEDDISLQQGYVLAEGKLGLLVSSKKDATIAGTLLFGAQADLPEGPVMPAGKALLYADLWERPIFALQDNYLADPGLHGAETSYRTRTMVQIKALPLTGEMTRDQAMDDLAKGTGMFRRKGDALAKVTPKNTEIAVDDCDPCADQVDIVPSVPNALFRLEVVEVTRDNKGRPSKARFAWSMENAAVIETMAQIKDPASGEAMKATFSRDGAVYQYFSDTTEAQIGRFTPGFDPIKSEFDKALGDKAFTHVRRWDGAAVVNVKNSTVPATDQIGQGKMTAAAGRAKLTVDAFTVEIAFADRELLAGDYWLIELRRFASQPDRVRLVGSTANKDALPSGIEHHFCALFLTDNGKGLVPSNAEKRRLSFPALTDIPASHVSFDSECPQFFDNAENVADALNALCDLDASQIRFDPPADCQRFDGTTKVDEALKELCSVQDDTMLTQVLRVMMDWGVVCGLRLKLDAANTTNISWTAGTMLDRTGRLVEVKPGKIDLRTVPEENIKGKLGDIMTKNGEICLSMAAGKNGKLEFFLTDYVTAFGPKDRDFREAVRACIEGRKWIDFGGIMRPLDKAEAGVVKKMADAWANRKAFDGKVPMTIPEETVAKAVNKTLVRDYVANAAPDRAKEIEIILRDAEAKFNPRAARGSVRDIRRMQLAAAQFGIIAAAEEEDSIACECVHAFTPCPPDPGKFGRLVPVACIKMVERTDNLTDLSEVCDFCCRKQAMTWRALRYYDGSFIDNRINEIKEKCCRPTEPKPGIDFGDWFDDWVGGIYDPKPVDPVPFPDPRPEPHPLWPPITRPGGGLSPINPGWTDPVPYGPGKYINPKPDISRLPLNQAATVLTGNGFDVVETLNLDDGADPFEKLGALGLKGDSVLGRDTPEPGDKVIMLSSGGKAVDFVVFEKGSGKLPFETEAETKARVEKIVATLDFTKAVVATPAAEPKVPTDFSAFENKLKDLMKDRDKAESELGKLAELRAKLSEDVGGLEAKMSEMSTLRETVTADIEKSRTELKKIAELKETSLRDISAATKELEDVQRGHDEFVVKMRREQPIESVLGSNTAAINALKARGMVTVGDIETAPTRNLTAVLNRTGLNGSTAKRLVDTFIKRR